MDNEKRRVLEVESILWDSFVKSLTDHSIPLNDKHIVCMVLMRMSATLATSLNLNEDEFLECCQMLFQDESEALAVESEVQVENVQVLMN